MRRHPHLRVVRPRSADGQARQPGLKRVEPRLLPANPARSLVHSAIADPGILSAHRDDEPKPSNSAAPSAPGRLPVAAVGGPARSLRYAALAGFVLAALAGFLWFAVPGTKTASSGGSAPDSRQVVRLPEPIPATPRTSASATASDTPGERDTKPTAAVGAPPKAQDEVAQPAPSTAAMSPSGPATGPPVSPAGAADIAAESPAAAKSFAQGRPTTGNHRPDRSRTTARRTHPRFGGEPHTPRPHSRSVQHAPPRPAQQAASFDRLVNQLTEPTPPVGQSLTPPAAGASDPFDSSEK